MDIMNKHPGVITDDKWILHMTIQYLCCYSFPDYVRIVEILASLKWKSFKIRFSKVICNYGGGLSSKDNSIIVLLDKESQDNVANFVENIEKKISDYGIPIHVPRKNQEPFHSTLGVVSGSYPINEVIDEINEKYPVFNEELIDIHSFFLVFCHLGYFTPMEQIMNMKN